MPAFYLQYKKGSLFLPPLRGSSRIKEWSTGCKICGWVNTLQDILGEYLLRHVGDYLEEIFFGIENGLKYENGFNAALH